MGINPLFYRLRRAFYRQARPLGTGALALAYALTNVAGLYSAETSFWKDRQRAAQGQQSGALMAQARPAFSPRPDVLPVVDASQLVGNRLPPSASHGNDVQRRQVAWLPDLVAPFGEVRELHLARNTQAPLVLHIQDIHEVEEAQRAQAGLIQALAQERGVTLVGLEAATGRFDLAPYRTLPFPEILAGVADLWLRMGYIGGAELAGLTSPNPLVLWGVEDGLLYGANLEAFSVSEDRRSSLESRLGELRSTAEDLKGRIYSPALKDFDSHFSSYISGRESLTDHTRYLWAAHAGAKRSYPNLALLRNAADAEDRLDFKTIEAERRALAEILARQLPPADLQRLIDHSVNQRLGRLSFGAYQKYLQTLCVQSGIDLKGFPQLGAYLDYVIQAERIDRGALLAELDALQVAAESDRARTPPERALVRARRDLGLLEKLARHQFTPTEWEAYAKRKKDIARLPAVLKELAGPEARGALSSLPPDLLLSYERFSSLALERNDALVNNLLAQMRTEKASAAVLVAGGFHTEGLTERFREEGVSYAVISPRLTAVPQEARALQTLVRDPLPIETLLAGDVITLAAPRTLGTQWNKSLSSVSSLAQRVRGHLTTQLRLLEGTYRLRSLLEQGALQDVPGLAPLLKANGIESARVVKDRLVSAPGGKAGVLRLRAVDQEGAPVETLLGMAVVSPEPGAPDLLESLGFPKAGTEKDLTIKIGGVEYVLRAAPAQGMSDLTASLKTRAEKLLSWARAPDGWSWAQPFVSKSALLGLATLAFFFSGDPHASLAIGALASQVSGAGARFASRRAQPDPGRDINIADIGVDMAAPHGKVNEGLQDLMSFGHEVLRLPDEAGLEEYEIHLVGSSAHRYVFVDTWVAQRGHAGGLSTVGTEKPVKRLWVARGYWEKDRAGALQVLRHEAWELNKWWKKAEELIGKGLVRPVDVDSEPSTLETIKRGVVRLLDSDLARLEGENKSLPTMREWISKNYRTAQALQIGYHLEAQRRFPVDSPQMESLPYTGALPDPVVLVSYEIKGYWHTGGLGDVLAEAPHALKDLGQEVVRIMPRWKDIKGEWADTGRTVTVGPPWGSTTFRIMKNKDSSRIMKNKDSSIDDYALEDVRGELFQNGYNDGDAGGESAKFCLGAREAMRALGIRPATVNAHDWSSALTLAFIRSDPSGYFDRTGTLFTVHNAEYPGAFDGKLFPFLRELGLPPELADFSPSGMEFFGQVSLLKAGVAIADKVNLVSPRYAHEMVQKPGIFQDQQHKVVGVLNGLFFDLYDSDKDPGFPTPLYEYQRFTINSTEEGKTVNKARLQKSLGLTEEPEAPLVSFIARLTEQKGMNLILDQADEILRDSKAKDDPSKRIQFVIMGVGDAAIADRWRELAKNYPRQVAFLQPFQQDKENLINAGADLVLAPSLWEPAGLAHLKGMMFGAVPIVRDVGGLHNSVLDVDERPEESTGFKFKEFTKEDFRAALNRALQLYRSSDRAFAAVRHRAMLAPKSWDDVGLDYLDLYRAAHAARERVVNARLSREGGFDKTSPQIMTGTVFRTIGAAALLGLLLMGADPSMTLSMGLALGGIVGAGGKDRSPQWDPKRVEELEYALQQSMDEPGQVQRVDSKSDAHTRTYALTRGGVTQEIAFGLRASRSLRAYLYRREKSTRGPPLLLLHPEVFSADSSSIKPLLVDVVGRGVGAVFLGAKDQPRPTFRSWLKAWGLARPTPPTWVEANVPELKNYSVYSRALESIFNRTLAERLGDRYGMDLLRYISQSGMTGGLGHVVFDYHEALSMDGLDVATITPLWNTIKGETRELDAQGNPKPLPLPPGFTSFGDMVRSVLDRAEVTIPSFRLPQDEGFLQWVANSPRVREALNREIFVDIYTLPGKYGGRPYYYPDAYYIKDGQKVYIFDELYSDPANGPWRAIQVMTYSQASQLLILELVKRGYSKDKVVTLDHEAFAQLPDWKLWEARESVWLKRLIQHAFNHTVFRPGLYTPPLQVAGMYGYDGRTDIHERRAQDAVLNLAQARNEVTDVLTGVAEIHRRVLASSLFREFSHKIRGLFNPDDPEHGLNSTNGVLMEHWRGPEIQRLIDWARGKVEESKGSSGALDEEAVFQAMNQPGQRVLKDEFKRRLMAIKSLYELDLLILLHRTQPQPLGGGGWLEETLNDISKKRGPEAGRYTLDNIDSHRNRLSFLINKGFFQPEAWATLDRDYPQLTQALLRRPIVSNVRRQVSYKGPDMYVRMLGGLAADAKQRADFVGSGVRLLIGGRMFGNEAKGQFDYMRHLANGAGGMSGSIAFIENYNSEDARTIFRAASAVVMLSDEFLEAAATSNSKGPVNGAQLLTVYDGASPEILAVRDESGATHRAIQYTYDALAAKIESGELKPVNGRLISYSNERSQQWGGGRRPDVGSLVTHIMDMGYLFRDLKSGADSVYDALSYSFSLNIHRQTRSFMDIESSAVRDADEVERFVETIRGAPGASAQLEDVLLQSGSGFSWTYWRHERELETVSAGGPGWDGFWTSVRMLRQRYYEGQRADIDEGKTGLGVWSFRHHVGGEKDVLHPLRYVISLMDGRPAFGSLKKRLVAELNAIEAMPIDAKDHSAQMAQLDARLDATMESLELVRKVMERLEGLERSTARRRGGEKAFGVLASNPMIPGIIKSFDHSFVWQKDAWTVYLRNGRTLRELRDALRHNLLPGGAGISSLVYASFGPVKGGYFLDKLWSLAKGRAVDPELTRLVEGWQGQIEALRQKYRGQSPPILRRQLGLVYQEILGALDAFDEAREAPPSSSSVRGGKQQGVSLIAQLGLLSMTAVLALLAVWGVPDVLTGALLFDMASSPWGIGAGGVILASFGWGWALRAKARAPPDLVYLGGGSGSKIFGEAPMLSRSPTEGPLLEAFVSPYNDSGSSVELQNGVEREWGRRPRWASRLLRLLPVWVVVWLGWVPVATVAYGGYVGRALEGGLREPWKRAILGQEVPRFDGSPNDWVDQLKSRIPEAIRSEAGPALEPWLAQVEALFRAFDGNDDMVAGLRSAAPQSVRNIVVLGALIEKGSYPFPGVFNRRAARRALNSLSRRLGSSVRAFPLAPYTAREVMLVADDFDDPGAQSLVGEKEISANSNRIAIQRISLRRTQSAQVSQSLPADPAVLAALRRGPRDIVIGPGSLSSLMGVVLTGGVVDALKTARQKGSIITLILNSTQNPDTLGHTHESVALLLERSLGFAKGVPVRLEDIFTQVIVNDPGPLPVVSPGSRSPGAPNAEQTYAEKITEGYWQDSSLPQLVEFFRSRGIVAYALPLAEFIKGRYVYRPDLLRTWLALQILHRENGVIVAALDKDGTLTEPNKTIEPSVAQALVRALRSGASVAIHTQSSFERTKQYVLDPLREMLGAEERHWLEGLLVITELVNVRQYDAARDEYVLRETTDLFQTAVDKLAKAGDSSEALIERLRSNAEQIGGELSSEVSAGVTPLLDSSLAKEVLQGWLALHLEKLKGNLASRLGSAGHGVNVQIRPPDSAVKVQAVLTGLTGSSSLSLREEAAATLNETFERLGVPFEASVAGTSSVDVTLKGVDKLIGLQALGNAIRVPPSSILFADNEAHGNAKVRPAAENVRAFFDASGTGQRLDLGGNLVISSIHGGPAGVRELLNMIAVVGEVEPLHSAVPWPALPTPGAKRGPAVDHERGGPGFLSQWYRVLKGLWARAVSWFLDGNRSQEEVSADILPTPSSQEIARHLLGGPAGPVLEVLEFQVEMNALRARVENQRLKIRGERDRLANLVGLDDRASTQDLAQALGRRHGRGGEKEGIRSEIGSLLLIAWEEAATDAFAAVRAAVRTYHAAQRIYSDEDRLADALESNRPLALELTENLVNGGIARTPAEIAQRRRLQWMAAQGRKGKEPIRLIVPNGVTQREVDRFIASDPSLSAIRVGDYKVGLKTGFLNAAEGKYSVLKLFRWDQGVARDADLRQSPMDLFLLDRSEWSVEQSVESLVRILITVLEGMVIDVTAGTEAVDADLKRLNIIQIQA